MGPGSHTELVKRSLRDDASPPFAERVREQAAAVAEAIEEGAFDNAGFTIGLELEGYAVDAHCRLADVPTAAFDYANKELGVHNVEFNTAATAFGPTGLAAQRDELTTALDEARAVSRDAASRRIVLDGMWTVPPPEGTASYLAATESRDGLTLPTNMRPSARYYALDRDIVGRMDGDVNLELPGVDLTLPTIMAESLTTSMQPHLQIPDPEAFPAYFNTAIRTLGPVLALSTNSPFLPADLYGEPEDPHAIIEAAHHESRIAVFEQSINTESPGKVRVPADLEAPGDVADRLVADATRAPFLREWTTEEPRASFRDSIWELTHKRGTYWRWVRGVIGGDPVGDAATERSLRIEYRPVPTQPTVSGTVGVQALVVGLIHGLVEADHPVCDLPWEAARDCFYRVAEAGFEAELEWVTATGRRTNDRDRVLDEVFEYARRGLSDRGVPEAAIDRLLGPLEMRRDRAIAPSGWKKRRVAARLDAGDGFEEAVTRAQTEYVALAASGRRFAEWPDPGTDPAVDVDPHGE